MCLRQMNNNPNLFGGPGKRPIVEFAIDSVRALKVQERKQRLMAERQAQRSLAEGALPAPAFETCLWVACACIA